MIFSKGIQTKLRITIISVFVFCVSLILLCSPIGKYLVEKYDQRFLGREITVDWMYVNPFTGFVHIHGAEVKELRNDSIFFSAEGISADFAMLKFLSSAYDITSLTIHHPVASIIQRKKTLNFDDILERFFPKESTADKVHFSVQKISIRDGEIHYREKIIPIDYFIKDVNLESSGIRWDNDTIASSFSFTAGTGAGTVTGKIAIKTSTRDYQLATVVKDFDLELIRQYLWELINYGMFRARLEADVTASGNFRDVNRISLKGRMAISDFHLGKTSTEDYLSCRRLSLVINELNPHEDKYLFDSVTVDHPFLSYERFDSLDNVQALFGKAGSNISDIKQQPGRFNLLITIGGYIKTLGQRFFESRYMINSLAVNNGTLMFTDHSLSETFRLGMTHVDFRGDSITKTNNRVKFFLKSGILPYGEVSARLSINPLDSGDLDLDYLITNLPVTAFNPYIITYTSFPLYKGVLALKGAWRVRGGMIRSENNITLVDPRVGARLDGDDTKWMPLPLVMSLVRERGNVINYEIPVTGHLKRPKFHLWDVVGDLLLNAIIKPATISYGVKVRGADKQIENMLTISWRVGQSKLDPAQERFVSEAARFLKTDRESSIDIYPQDYTSKEKEHILFFEARKKYYLEKHHKSAKEFNEEDSLITERMSVKDLGHYFTKDLVKITRDTTMFTMIDKCTHFLNSNIVETKYRQLIQTRQNELRSFFAHNLTSDRMTIHPQKHGIPFDGFSCDKINYNGKVPPTLQKTYLKMHELNARKFRRKYFGGHGG